jgi:CHASE2 domain-containing sensor protein
MAKRNNRQARRAQQSLLSRRNKRDRFVRSGLALIVAIFFSAVFYQLGILHQLEPAFGRLEARLEARSGTSEVALVVIDDNDYQKFFGSTSPLNPAALHSLIDAIAAGKPKLIGVDIDTSDPQFKSFQVSEAWPPIVWLQVVEGYPGSGARSTNLQPRASLGERVPQPPTGLALLIDTADGVTRRYQRLIETANGPLPSLPWAIVNGLEVTKTSGLQPSTDELVIRYSSDVNRFRLSASQVLDLRDSPGWKNESPIEDRIVLLGGSYGVGDRHETPLGTMTGIEVLANSIETELDGGGHAPPSMLVLILLLTFEGLAGVLIFHKLRLLKGVLWSIPAMIILSATCSLLAYQSLTQLPYFLFLLVVIVAYQGFEVFRHNAILKASEAAAEVGHDASQGVK